MDSLTQTCAATLGLAHDSILLNVLGLFTVFIIALASFTVLYVVYHLKAFFFPRKNQFKESYPFEAMMVRLCGIRENKILEVISGIIADTYKSYGRKTVIMPNIGMPDLIFTGSIENITHILKTNFDNYGKAGPGMKPKLQELLGDGIFNVDGHAWYAHRKTSALIFKLNRFKTSVSTIFHDDMDQVMRWIHIQKGASFDFQALMHRFTLESIARIAFGVTFDIISKDRVEFAEDFDFCTWSINKSLMDPFWWISKYFTPTGWKYYKALNHINKFTTKIIQERRAKIEAEGSGANTNDLLSLYLDKGTFGEKTIQGEGSENTYKSYDDTFLEPTDSNLRDVILNMIIAGRDTTAQALSWSFYRMCIHDGVQEKVREEVVRILKESGEYETLKAARGVGSISYDTLQKMKYLEGFIMEVLRLHPSVPREAKAVFKDDVLPDGTEVKEGDIVLFSPWAMGRDPDLWGEDCLEFKPERFIGTAKPSPFVFSAFQAGPRTCLGQNFALLEMKIAIARMLIIFSFALAQDPATITYEISLTLPIKGGLQMTTTELK